MLAPLTLRPSAGLKVSGDAGHQVAIDAAGESLGEKWLRLRRRQAQAVGNMTSGRTDYRKFICGFAVFFVTELFLWWGPHAGTTSEDQRNCRSDGWQYSLVLQQVVCAFDYAMRRSSWMHVQGLSSAISYAS
jgi:hypothetical protein